MFCISVKDIRCPSIHTMEFFRPYVNRWKFSEICDRQDLPTIPGTMLNCYWFVRMPTCLAVPVNCYRAVEMLPYHRNDGEVFSGHDSMAMSLGSFFDDDGIFSYLYNRRLCWIPTDHLDQFHLRLPLLLYPLLYHRRFHCFCLILAVSRRFFSH